MSYFHSSAASLRFVLSRRTLSAGLLVILLLTGNSSPASGDDDAKRKAIRFLAGRTAANYQNLRTWQGRYEVSTTLYHPSLAAFTGPSLRPDREAADRTESVGPITVLREAELEFAIDFEADALYTSVRHTRPQQVREDRTGREIVVEGISGLDAETITTPDEHLVHPDAHIGPLVNQPLDPLRRGSTNSDIVYRAPPPQRPGEKPFAAQYDPKEFLPGDDDLFIWETLNLYVQWSTGNDADAFRRQVKVDETPDGYTLTIRFRTREGQEDLSRMPYTVYEFAKSSRYNLAALTSYSPDGKVFHSREWTYREAEDGIMVPETLVQVLNTPDGRTRVSRKEFRLLESVVNEELPAETFTAEKFDLADGARFYDRVDGRLSVLHKGKALPAVEYFEKVNSPAANDQSGRFTLILVLNLVLLAVLACVYMVRRRARQQKG
ncbi:hypothetical protein Mal4_58710 [Maioricimonas rarisocia]|uniref:Uncharacterized protein n=1 Tax=Maioricimonas rarisocia TaxID=2528026 RepID=A0A517ZG85_9PLAN|nr:hypothetical protein [Maioricimonas rarisocia]QDU41503.1 hypothetical protein Mal4_58710 [Maioricimonas rarisocia]